MIKVGLIGCGTVAQVVHLSILSKFPDVELTAAAEADAKRRTETRQRFPNMHLVEDYHELLGMTDIDAVVICLPNALHAEAAQRAFEQGKHVYLEKPLATNLDEGFQVVSAWRRAGTVGMMGFNYRFNPLYQAARQHIQSGKLGKLNVVQTVFATAAHPMPAWKQSQQTGGGVLLDLASHHIDLLRFLFHQDVSEVSAMLQSRSVEADTAVLQLRLENGTLAQIFTSLSAVEEDRIQVYGDAGKLTVDRFLSLGIELSGTTRQGARLRQISHQMRLLTRAGYLLTKMREPYHEPSYRLALAYFLGAIRGEHRASPDIEDGYHNLRVTAAAEKAAYAGGFMLSKID